MKYYPMQMHLHTVHQPGASMESHIFNAAALGMKYIRFTDHDTRMGKSDKTVNTFDFTGGVLEYETEAGVSCGWQAIGDGALSAEEGNLLITSFGGTSGAKFFSKGQKHSRALLSEVTLTLGIESKLAAGSRIIIDILLSQRPPEHKEAHFLYVLGTPKAGRIPGVAYVNIDPRADGIYRLELSRDIEKFPEVGGLDNVFGTVSVSIEGEGTASLYKMEIESVYEYNELMLRQRALAAEIGEKWGVTPFVTSEISGAGQHKNCYSSSVPVINHGKGKVNEAEAIAHVLSFGGIFCYNHPFESSKYKRKAFSREELDAIVEYESARLAENAVFGASLMEVGFPHGRGLFTLADYLKLWDNLALRGVFITGDGDSDSHKSHRGWYNGNNFVSYIGVDDGEKHPIAESVFNDAMLSGRVYMGDPTVLKGEVTFRCLGAEMGSVIRAERDEYPITLSLESTSGICHVRIIENGECVSDECTHGGGYKKTYALHPCKYLSFARAEAYDANGRCVMLTNPIYFVGEEFDKPVPAARLVDGVK